MSDEEDEFLYGSEAPESKRLKEDVAKDNKEPGPEPMDQEEDGGQKVKANEDEEDDDEDSESDSDSDVEFVINAEPGKKVAAPTSQAPYANVKEDEKKDDSKEDGTEEAADADKTESGTGTSGTSGTTTERPPGIDINAVADYEGKPITQVNLENFEEKPWRQPGADVTDYFNYGFDEFTWSAYCSKQDNLREDFSGQKVMSRMMGGMGGPMPPMDMSSMFPMPMPGAPQGRNNMPAMGNNQMDMNQMMMMGMMPGFMNQAGQQQPQQQQQQRQSATPQPQNDSHGGNGRQQKRK